ncbi:hypothetical protein SAMD00019534_065750 [Acytostelium subglobosum LB1]|uniref:hypothetical protein n=1 Tax=Acytostelium subglobosum LB1 TaxID=1410327 RepID=UPI0006449243|nr:hypothetical protein SAMD00019534_065750 [Acytostelium subglobosum LB1]GAM23400.1 hypothetical protein SAMD00019534_065750 [Acytostelium subglobosum LB1]|eukprot:XP_012753849.1 hypothetical protein SAMD00019534_065750 [Acytostelium subglobosum LB1]
MSSNFQLLNDSSDEDDRSRTTETGTIITNHNGVGGGNGGEQDIELDRPLLTSPTIADIDGVGAHPDESALILEDIQFRDDTNLQQEQKQTQQQQQQGGKKKVPLWCYVILVAALLAMSSSGPALKKMDVPPLRKASWRLQVTSIMLLIGFLVDLHTLYPLFEIHLAKSFVGVLPAGLVSSLPISWQTVLINVRQTKFASIDERRTEQSECRARFLSWKTWVILTGTGCVLAGHFGMWISSLNKTSLSHSLLFVTSNPIMIVIVMVVMRKPISKGEIFGCLIGFIGLVITMFDSLFLTSGPVNGIRPTVYGDFLALMAAVCIVFYLFAGSNLRTWMSLYLYAFPVTFIASLVLTFSSLIFETMPVAKEGQNFGVFGWASPAFVWLALYVAFFPGIVGHTGVNAIIKYVEPVVISVTLLLEPPIGTVMGYFVGEGEIPGIFTYIGGPIVVAGCGMVTVASYFRNKREQAATQTADVSNVSLDVDVDDASVSSSIASSNEIMMDAIPNQYSNLSSDQVPSVVVEVDDSK